MILPSPPETFSWTTCANRPALVCGPLAEVAEHFLTTRHWPLGTARSNGGENDQAWAAVAEAAGVAPERLLRLRQVHGVAVALGVEPFHEPPAADIVVPCDSTLAAAVQSADCVPLLLADRKTGGVAAVHCGWRGIALDAARVGVYALEQAWGSEPEDLVAALGPSIGACCYEVGAEVRQTFVDRGVPEDALARWFLGEPMATDRNRPMPAVISRPRRRDHWFFDGWRAVAEQLQAAGVPGDAIFASNLCTASHPEVFCSYRAEGATAGRMVGVIRSAMPRP